MSTERLVYETVRTIPPSLVDAVRGWNLDVAALEAVAAHGGGLVRVLVNGACERCALETVFDAGCIDYLGRTATWYVPRSVFTTEEVKL